VEATEPWIYGLIQDCIALGRKTIILTILMVKVRFLALAIVLIGIAIGFFVYSSEKNQTAFSFNYGLDLIGGTHLVYKADISNVDPIDVGTSMEALRDVIERRVNLFGVSEPIVQVEKSGVFAVEAEERLIVELPGITDVEEAVALIGKTPLLEFKLVNITEARSETGDSFPIEYYVETALTGRYIERAQLEFGSGGAGHSNEPVILLLFSKEGADVFSELTKNNVGKQLAIFLDGVVISSPVIREEITGGQATISGNFDPEEARELVRDLNFGALPLPIELLGTQTVGASLGKEALGKGVVAGGIGFIAVIIFLIFWYRISGVVASVSLLIYISIMFALFKLVPITLTSAGIAGLILSVGMAVDANILIFERMKEEIAKGKSIHESVTDGFKRAWLPIRDGNISSIITAIILFWFGTSIVEGFALTFGLGVIVSMITAITITRTLLLALPKMENRKLIKILFGK